jgi:hypothetical protein
LAITPVVKHPASPAALRMQNGAAARKEEPHAAQRSRLSSQASGNDRPRVFCQHVDEFKNLPLALSVDVQISAS